MATSIDSYAMEQMLRAKMAQHQQYDYQRDQLMGGIGGLQNAYAKNPEDTPKSAPKKEEPNPVLLLI